MVSCEVLFLLFLFDILIVDLADGGAGFLGSFDRDSRVGAGRQQLLRRCSFIQLLRASWRLQNIRGLLLDDLDGVL